MKKFPFLLTLGILVILIVSAYTGYLYWQKSDYSKEILGLGNSIADSQNKMLQYENKEVLGAINAKKAFSELKIDAIEWSKIIKKIRDTIPNRDGTALVEVLSYSGSASNEISMNVKTKNNSEKPYFDVADLIEAFDESEYFADSFVPSISSGADDKGKEILSFLFSTKYVENKPSDELESTIGQILDESLEKDVKRVLR